MTGIPYRQFVWGLSNGITVLAISGGSGFIGSRHGSSADRAGFELPVLLPTSMALLVGGLVSILIAALRLRRKATGFRLAEVRHGDDRQRQETKRIILGLRWVIAAEAVLIVDQAM